MLQITKEKKEAGYCFIISNDEGRFSISFEGNLDLYWRYLYPKSINSAPESKSFTITKENYFLYSLLEELYDEIKNCNIFKVTEFDISNCNSIEDLNNLYLMKKKLNNSLMEKESYNPYLLFQDGIIKWHSDEADYEDTSVLNIKKEGETFIIIFEKSKNINVGLTYSVGFCNFGSRYSDFTSTFMKMYHKLIEYNPNFHQIHIEEYLWQKRLAKSINNKY